MAIDLKVETFKRCWLFSDLDTDRVKEVASLADLRRYCKGEFIFHEGDPADFLYIVASGTVKQFKSSPSGRAFTTVISASGNPLCAVALFGTKAYFLSAQAISEANVYFVTRKGFLSFVEKYPVIMTRSLVTMGMVINSAYERLSDFVGETASQRVLNVLYMLYFKFGDAVFFTREEIADMAGTTAETAVRVLGKLRAAGIIESRRGGVVVLDETKLRNVCRRSYLIPVSGPDGQDPLL
jgi:CRP/FNR family transcriptional regulator, nitrogen oxide reductase regulator